MVETLKFFDVKSKKSFRTNKFRLKMIKGRKFAIAKSPFNPGMEAFRIVKKDFKKWFLMVKAKFQMVTGSLPYGNFELVSKTTKGITVFAVRKKGKIVSKIFKTEKEATNKANELDKKERRGKNGSKKNWRSKKKR